MTRSNKKVTPLVVTDGEQLELYLRRAFEIAAPHVVDGKVYFAELDHAALDTKLVQSIQLTDLFLGPRDKLIDTKPNLDRAGTFQYLASYQASLRSANIIRARMSDYLRANRPMPTGLRDFLVLLLERRVAEPKNPSHRPSESHRDMLLQAIALVLKDNFKLKMGANKATMKKTFAVPLRGATIAAAALYGLGCEGLSSDQAIKVAAMKKLRTSTLMDMGLIGRIGDPVHLSPRSSSCDENQMKRAFRFLNRKYPF